MNTAFADTLNAAGWKDTSVSDFWIRATDTTNARGMIEAGRSQGVGEIREAFKISDDYLDNLKFNECLPIELAHGVLRDRMLRDDEIESAIRREVVDGSLIRRGSALTAGACHPPCEGHDVAVTAGKVFLFSPVGVQPNSPPQITRVARASHPKFSLGK